MAIPYRTQVSTNDPLAQLSDEELQALFDAYREAGTGEPEVPVVEEAPPELSAGEAIAGGVRELAGGALFEFADEAEAAARAPFSEKSYEDLLRDIRQNRARFSEAYPATALGLNVAGGVGSLFVPGVNVIGRGAQVATGINRITSPVRRAVASGALAGGVAGVGSGEDAMGRIQSGAVGTLLGAGLGAGAYGIGRGAQWGRDVFTARSAEMPEDEARRYALDIINRRISESNLTPEQVADMARMEQTYGMPGMFGTTTPELSRLTENVMQTPSGERADLARSLFSAQTGAPRRVEERIRQSIPTPDYFASEERIIQTLRDNAKASYGAVNDVEIPDPVIMDILRNPDIKGAYADALANVERDMAAAALRGEDPSPFALRKVFEPVLDEQGALVGLSDTPTTVPDIKTLNQIKIALDRRIDGLYSTGKGGEATALKNLRNAFVDRLDKVGPPEYLAARQQYKGDIEVKEALEAGRNANRLRWQEVNKLAKDFSPGELQAFKTGVVQNIMKRFEDTSQRRNFAKEIIDNKNTRKSLQALMEPGEFQVFETALRREAELFTDINRITQGSATFGRAAERADIEEQIAGGNVEDAVSLLVNPTPGNILQRTASILANMRNANVSRATYTQLARMLRSSSPDELDTVLRQLEEAAPAQQVAERTFERGVTKAGAGAAMTIAPSPEMERERLPEVEEVVVPDTGEPVSGLGVMPPAGEVEGAPPPGGVPLAVALERAYPGYTAIFNDGSLVVEGVGVPAEDVAKTLDVPVEAWLAANQLGIY
jgi:hypothetical protein